MFGKQTRWHERSILTLVLLTGWLSALGCQSKQEGEIRIGLITSLTGEYANHGRSAINAAELAIKKVNEAGGLNISGQKHKVILLVEDNKDIPQVAVNAGRKLIYQENVVALVGPSISRNAIPVATMAEKAGIPMISPLSTNAATTEDKQYVFRVAFVDDFQGLVLARFAREELNARKAALLYDVAHAYNKGVADVFKRVFEADGGKIVASETYTTDENQDFNSQFTRIRDSKPDVLVLPNYTDHVALQVQVARELGVTATILGSDGWDEWAFADIMDFEGSFFSHHWHPDLANAQSKVFTEKFRQVYDRIPDSNAALTYDAFGLLFQAIEKQGQAEPESIRTGLSGTDGYEGVSGTISYRGSGDPVKDVLILQIRKGKVHIYKIVNLQSPSDSSQY